MNRLLSAGFARLWKNKTLWFGTVVMFAWATVRLVAESPWGPGIEKEIAPLEQFFFEYGSIIGCFCAVFISLFLGTDYSDGTIRNKVLVGHSRTALYGSNLVVSAVAGLIITAAWVVPMLVIGVPLFGWFTVDPIIIALYLLITIFMITAFSSLFTMFSMLNDNKAVVAVITLLTFFILLYLGGYSLSRLYRPEMLSGGLVIATEGTEITAKMLEPEPNPLYLTGNTRKLLEFVVALLPTGQGFRISHMTVEAIHYWKMPLYSTLLIIATSFFGITFFQRKDLQ